MFSILKLIGPSQSQYGFPPLGSFINATPELPVTDQLVGSYFLRNSPDRLKNYADPSKPLTLVGSPSAADTFSWANLSNHYDTRLIPPKDWTVIAISSIGNNNTSDGGLDVSNYGDNGATPPILSGDSIGANNTGSNTTLYANVLNGSELSIKSVNVSYPVGTQFQLYAGVFQNAPAFKKIDAISGGITSYPVDMADRTRVASLARTLKIGGHHRTGILTGNRRISFVAVYFKVLSDAEIKQIGDYLRLNWCPAVGILLS
ncbi:hypothetical protein [Serratia proteamaculans]|uniref:hypothetical protein n=1 Tax=Serratia proteamaculans TaxID=28151 RepID=UPI002178E8C2|nr:hypothetical protein [Serratia proteamaculans]CAI1577755.1 Uncharacterised protein [Serratia proteamaculans]